LLLKPASLRGSFLPAAASACPMDEQLTLIAVAGGSASSDQEGRGRPVGIIRSPLGRWVGRPGPRRPLAGRGRGAREHPGEPPHGYPGFAKLPGLFRGHDSPVYGFRPRAPDELCAFVPLSTFTHRSSRSIPCVHPVRRQRMGHRATGGCQSEPPRTSAPLAVRDHDRGRSVANPVSDLAYPPCRRFGWTWDRDRHSRARPARFPTQHIE
jgi:hypothetical protein